VIFGLEFPPIDNLVVWPGFFNKIALIYLIALIVPVILFALAIRQHDLVPRGVRQIAEGTVTFIEKGIIMPTIGPDGLVYLPFLSLRLHRLLEPLRSSRSSHAGQRRMGGPRVRPHRVGDLDLHRRQNHGAQLHQGRPLPPGVPRRSTSS
jgi:hypothetical protein